MALIHCPECDALTVRGQPVDWLTLWRVRVQERPRLARAGPRPDRRPWGRRMRRYERAGKGGTSPRTGGGVPNPASNPSRYRRSASRSQPPQSQSLLSADSWAGHVGWHQGTGSSIRPLSHPEVPQSDGSEDA